MDNTGEVLKYLRECRDFVSGDYISDKLNVSRTAVWKYMNQLERHGYSITSVKGRGYRLEDTPDKLFPWEIERYRTSTILGGKIVHRETVDSTNALAFKLAMEGEPEGTCVVAETQTRGKGRLGRKWSSPAGKNIYLSVILRPPVHPLSIYPVTFLSSLAVYDTILTITGQIPELKWPNDVLLNGKKICGSLLELSTETEMVRFVVVGIGLNVNGDTGDFDRDIRTKATSMFLETKNFFERAHVCGMLLSNLGKYYLRFKEGQGQVLCREWEKAALIKGKYLEINQMGKSFQGTAIGVDIDGAILLKINGIVQKIIAGDVSF